MRDIPNWLTQKVDKQLLESISNESYLKILKSSTSIYLSDNFAFDDCFSAAVMIASADLLNS